MDALLGKLTEVKKQFEVVEKEIDGVKYPFFKNLPKNLNELYQIGQQFHDKSFLVHHGKSLSYQDVLDQMGNLAHILVNRFGIKKGDRVALAMRNLPEWCVAFMAITSVGGIVVAMNSWWKTEELLYAINSTTPILLIVDSKRLEYLKGDIAATNIQTIVVRPEGPLPDGVIPYDTLLDDHVNLAEKLPEVRQEDDAVIFFTSGSTGFPKAALSNHRMLLTTIFSWALVGKTVETIEGNKNELVAQRSILVSLPLFHVTACYNLFLLSIVIGRKLVFLDKWDVDIAMQTIEREKITHFVGVPTMTYELLNAESRSHYNLSSLWEMGGGGAARPASQVHELYDEFKIPISIGYGMTETNALGSLNGGESYQHKPGSVGRATAPMVSIKIVDENDIQLGTNERGEIFVKSAANIKCYWNDEQASRELLRQGWVATGDIGYLDKEGYLYIVDRKKNIIIRGGENISSLEVEATIITHPAVKETAVFGVPDSRLGEIIIAVIAIHSGAELTAGLLKKYMAQKLADFKIPQDIQIVKTLLPRGATGKIDKMLITKKYLKEGNINGEASKS